MLLFLNIDSQLSLFLSSKLKIILCLMTLAFTFLLPVLNIWLLVKTKFISSIYMDKREERNISYLATLIFYLAQYYLLHNIQLFAIIKLLMLGACLSLAVTFIINLAWKISAHMTAIGGMAGALFAFNPIIDISIALPATLLIAGIIGVARLWLNAHTSTQVYAGFIIGFCSVAGLYSFSHYLL